MRIPISDNNRIDQDTKQTKELDNQDVDMRVLTMGMRPMEQKKHKKTDAKTSRSSNDRPTAHSHKTIDYSQYLKDANIDLDQSDLDDPIGRFYTIIFFWILNRFFTIFRMNQILITLFCRFNTSRKLTQRKEEKL